MSEARMVAVNCELFTNVVARVLPFQLTTETGRKPVPLTIRVNSAPLGATASGIRGWLISGTGFAVPGARSVPVTDLLNVAKPRRSPTEQRKKPIKRREL